MTDIEIVDTIIIPHEGGIYTNHPNDRGGPTRWGITIPILSKFRGYPVTADDIKNLTRQEATECYLAFFIRPFDVMTGQFRINAIDFGVNAGVDRAARMVQQLIGADVDGRLGPQTAELAKSRNWNNLYTGSRLLFYEQLIVSRPQNLTFRNGWRNRALSFIDAEVRQLRVRRTVRRAAAPVYGVMAKAYL